MRVNNALRCFAFVLVTCNYSTPAFASGIPTVDVASLTQAVTDYLNQLEQYTEMMNQGVVQEQELLQAIEQYQQMLIEYEHMLEQMSELEEKVSARDWEGIFAMYQDILNSFPSSEPDYTDPEWQEADEKLGKVFHRGSGLEELESEIAGMPYPEDSMESVLESSRATYKRSQLATGQQVVVDKMNSRLRNQMELSDELDDTRLSLGPESHLRTLQLLVEQNQAILDALHQGIAVDNAQLQFANQMDAHFFSAQQRARESRLRQLQAEMAEPLVVNEDPLVNF